MDETRRYCVGEGYLVSAFHWVPREAWDVYWGGLPVFGCGGIRCTKCGAMVRQALGYRVRSGVRPDPASLHAAADWATHPQVEFVPGERSRLYTCACGVREERATLALGAPVRDPLWDVAIPWTCAGHPPLDLPADVDGVRIDDDVDVEALTRDVLAGAREVPVPVNEADHRAWWLDRLYHLLGEHPLAVRLTRAAAESLEDPDPRTQRRALELFAKNPLSPGAERLDGMSSRLAALSEVPDPFWDGQSLGDVLSLALRRRLERAAERGLPLAGPLRERLQEAVALPRASGSLVRGLAAVDAQWVADHAGEILVANPGLAKDLLAALNSARVGPEVLVEAGSVVASTAGVDAEVLGRFVDEVIREPARTAILEALDRPRPVRIGSYPGLVADLVQQARASGDPREVARRYAEAMQAREGVREWVWRACTDLVAASTDARILRLAALLSQGCTLEGFYRALITRLDEGSPPVPEAPGVRGRTVEDDLVALLIGPEVAGIPEVREQVLLWLRTEARHGDVVALLAHGDPGGDLPRALATAAMFGLPQPTLVAAAKALAAQGPDAVLAGAQALASAGPGVRGAFFSEISEALDEDHRARVKSALGL